MERLDENILTYFYKNTHISLNNGPILKIQNLAYSGHCPLSELQKNITLMTCAVYMHNDVMFTFCGRMSRHRINL